MLIHNARIWTNDPGRPWADAALAADGRWVFVGRRNELAAPAGVREYDALGRLLIPGFIDGHAHLLNTGFAMRSVDLKGVPSVAQAAERVAARVAATPAGGWVRGAGWDQNDWPGARFPTRRQLDAVAPEHPVVLAHTSGHCVWVNSAALRAAGITAATAPPEGGAIDLGEDGEPSGILRDNASTLVERVAPRPSHEERVTALREAIAHAHALGVTGAHAMNVGAGEWSALRALHEAGELQFRTRVFLTAERLDQWIDEGVRTGDGDEALRLGGVKFFADGALGSLTAWMLEPYEGRGDTGFPLQAVDVLEERVRRCLGAGLAPAIHAIGDRANRETLGIIERSRDVAPGLPRRIEHAQLLAADDLPRFAALGVTASAQPIHATQDMTKVDREWGARGRGAYAFASLLASGANLAFGSDTPVETIDPIAGVHAAITRRRADGTPAGGWYPDERLPLDAALRAYTSGCAAAAGEEGRLGRIAAGCHADAVLLSHDIFALKDAMEILKARADLTLVGGVAVYERV